jgi:hypothetical protein
MSTQGFVYEMQPTDDGDVVSWAQLRKGCVAPATDMERQFGLTVPLSDTVTKVMRFCASIDPTLSTVADVSGHMLFPNVHVTITGGDFTVETEKVFAGGANRQSIFNYRVWIFVKAKHRETAERLRQSFNMGLPRPFGG